MNSEIFGTWLDEIFLPRTAHLRTPETPVVLVLDGFEAHEYLPTLQRAEQNHVHILRLPAHATHLCQPLDLAIMGPLHTYFNQAVGRWVILKLGPLKAAGLVKCLAVRIGPHTAAWDAAFTPDNVRAGFRKAGIFPFDEHALDGKGSDERAPEKENVDPLDMLMTAALEPADALLQSALAELAPAPSQPPSRPAKQALLLTSSEHLAKKAAEQEKKEAEKQRKAAAAEERKRKKEANIKQKADADAEKEDVKRLNRTFGEFTDGGTSFLSYLQQCWTARDARPSAVVEEKRQNRAARVEALRALRADPAGI